MNQYLESGQEATPLARGMFCLVSAEQARELAAVMASEYARLAEGLPAPDRAGAASESDACRLARLAVHIELHRLDRTDLAVYQGREQLMAGATALLDKDASLECHDAMRLLALLIDKLLRGGRSPQAKLDELTITAMESRALAAQSPNTGAVVQGSWRRKDRHQLGRASWLDVVEAALWCFWHSDDVQSGEALLGVLLGADERVRLIYGLLAGAFYLADVTTPADAVDCQSPTGG
ncbi:ADP-ribosylglycohydrolase [Aeromonas salmonicida]|uniref:ADP-ribosylglycohydrolase n=1 Tax=Aeromonas salmonicida TaxID=645 RepID=UPI001F35FEBE|nr:ADP-ribosylglycohydrolase [Aeromonas salmonicida]MCE9935097.1 ADP-ribosylglycohydrolase [Aeromonas salmonicida]